VEVVLSRGKRVLFLYLRRSFDSNLVKTAPQVFAVLSEAWSEVFVFFDRFFVRSRPFEVPLSPGERVPEGRVRVVAMQASCTQALTRPQRV
jgi:hypothetical protein